MAAPLVKPFVTYAELCSWPADGNRWQLIDGEAYMSPSPSLRHQKLLRRLVEAFQVAIPDRSEVFFAPLDVVLDTATALQPDLVLVLERNLAILDDVVRGTPDLVAEVLSPSTANLDRGPKMEAYARHGVPEYWLVDDETRILEIHRLDASARAYRRAAALGPGDRAATPLLPALALDVAALFAP